MNTAVTQLDKVTQQNAANAEESASAAEELNGQAQELQGMVESFKLTGGQTSDVKRETAKASKAAPVVSTQVHELLSKPKGVTVPVAANGNGISTPEQVIPLDSEDFKSS